MGHWRYNVKGYILFPRSSLLALFPGCHGLSTFPLPLESAKQGLNSLKTLSQNKLLLLLCECWVVCPRGRKVTDTVSWYWRSGIVTVTIPGLQAFETSLW